MFYMEADGYGFSIYCSAVPEIIIKEWLHRDVQEEAPENKAHTFESRLSDTMYSIFVHEQGKKWPIT